MNSVFDAFEKLTESWKYYPKGYNPKIHGPYDPSKFYGKKDVKFSEVKLGEIPDWIARRNKGVTPTLQVIDRGVWRWRMKYLFPKRITLAPIYQFAFLAFVGVYIFKEYPHRKHHKYALYH
ncbi:hypothetical protein SNEBB_007783 [Seison nebaliae]|nr:hypothetical protein SNEBB_007783 [Seison nebaliae]